MTRKEIEKRAERVTGRFLSWTGEWKHVALTQEITELAVQIARAVREEDADELGRRLVHVGNPSVVAGLKRGASIIRAKLRDLEES